MSGEQNRALYKMAALLKGILLLTSHFRGPDSSNVSYLAKTYEMLSGNLAQLFSYQYQRNLGQFLLGQYLVALRHT